MPRLAEITQTVYSDWWNSTHNSRRAQWRRRYTPTVYS